MAKIFPHIKPTLREVHRRDREPLLNTVAHIARQVRQGQAALTVQSPSAPPQRLTFAPQQAERLRQAFTHDDIRGWRIAIAHAVCALRIALACEPAAVQRHASAWSNPYRNMTYKLLCVMLAIACITESDFLVLEAFYSSLSTIREPAAASAVRAARNICAGCIDAVGAIILDMVEHWPTLSGGEKRDVFARLEPRVALYNAEGDWLEYRLLWGW